MCGTERLTKKSIIIFTFNILFSIFYFHSLNSFLYSFYHHYERRHCNQFALASNDWNFHTSKSEEIIQNDEAIIQERKILKNCKSWQRNNIYFNIHRNFRKLNQQWQVAFRQKCKFWRKKVKRKNSILFSELHQRQRSKIHVKANDSEKNMKSFNQQIHEEASNDRMTIFNKIYELQKIFWYVNWRNIYKHF